MSYSADDYQLLQSELENDPHGLGLSGRVALGDDSTVVEILNTPYHPVLGAVEVAVIQAELQKMIHPSGVSVWRAIRQVVVNNEAPDSLRLVCQMVIDVAEAKFNEISLALPEVAAVLDALYSAEILNLTQRERLDDLATRALAHWERIGLPRRVTEKDLIYLRNLQV